MSSIQKFSEQNNPFEAIKYIDEQGNEFWGARNLMQILGYKQWQKFKAVIEIAEENIESITQSKLEHFLPVEIKNNERGRPKIDYKLSRLACYHIALCCDSRGNDSVKAAKHYFAVKTREAEIVVPAQNERLRELELQVELANAERDNALAQQKLLETREAIVRLCPEPVQQKILGFQIVEKKEIIERVVDVDGALVRSGETLNKTQLCRRYGLLTNNGKPDYRTLNKLLDSVELPSEAWELTASIQENRELRRGYLGALDRILLNSSQRQMWLGE